MVLASSHNYRYRSIALDLSRFELLFWSISLPWGDKEIRLIANKINKRAKIVNVRPALALFLARLIGYAVRDVVITGDKIEGLMSNLLVSQSEPTALTLFSEWLAQNADNIGIKYISGLRRSYC